MRYTLHFRFAPRALARGIGYGASLGALMLNSRVRLDSGKTVTTQRRHYENKSECLVPQHVIQQVSSGSVMGFVTGLLVSTFSRTLALLGVLLTVSVQTTSSYGLNFPYLIGIDRQVLEKLLFWRSGTANPWFMASFVLTFILAAFVRL